MREFCHGRRRKKGRNMPCGEEDGTASVVENGDMAK
jgi:hypothetical protein